MSSTLKISLIQSSLHWENISANLRMFSSKIAALNESPDIIVLPEMFSTGFSMNAAALAESMDGSAVQWLRKTAFERNCIVTGSLIIREGGKFYNRLVWMNPDGTLSKYDKRHLFRLAHEEQTYTAGKEKLLIHYKGWRIFPLICFDLRFPVWSRRTKPEDYDLLIYVANWPERRVYAWSQLLIARAIENQCYVAGVNRVGNDGNNIYHSGESVLLNYKGEIRSTIKSHEESAQTIELNKDELDEFRKILPFQDDADSFKINV